MLVVLCNSLIVWDLHMCPMTYTRTEVLSCWSHTCENASIHHIFHLLPRHSRGNYHNTAKIEAIFGLVFLFLHDNAFILLFIPKCKDIRQDVYTYSIIYGFTLLRDWWGVNDMKLYTSTNVSSTINIAIFFITFWMQFEFMQKYFCSFF